MTDPEIKDAAFIRAARLQVGPSDDFEINSDDNSVSRNETAGESNGAYVKVWVWVDNDSAKEAAGVPERPGESGEE